MPKDKIFNGILVVFVLLSAVMIWMRGNEFVAVENPDKELQGQAYIKYWDKLNEAYKKDNYGGATPEETLDMFITALKTGDLELASKYFVVEKQPFMLEGFKKSTNNYISDLIFDIERATDKIELSSNEYRFRTRDVNGGAEFSFDLILNSYTNKWKIYDL